MQHSRLPQPGPSHSNLFPSTLTSTPKNPHACLTGVPRPQETRAQLAHHQNAARGKPPTYLTTIITTSPSKKRD
ncbi:uncharacterized protein BKA78DRAFT_326585 [Phyllosticta capitalensis]|uniref:uncharacterized protein n=1 Tax=Phyllosticta capitalensis TaxID=121624 RepID=UPI003131A5A9